MSGQGRKWFPHPMKFRILVFCLLPSTFYLLPSAFSQGLFPSQGQRSKDAIPTSPQPLGSTAATRDSAGAPRGRRPEIRGTAARHRDAAL